jgi:hypothetical protein
MAKELVGGITAFANGPDEMRQACVIFFFLKSRVHILLLLVLGSVNMLNWEWIR